MTINARAVRHGLLACLLFCLSAVDAADGKRQFGAWSTMCSGDAYCSASTRVVAPGATGTYSFQLRISRFAAGTHEVVFLPARDTPKPGEPIRLQVDQGAAVMLQADEGYRRIGNGSTYGLAAEAADALLAAARNGKQLRISYADASGKPVVASFNLSGLPAALAAIGIKPTIAKPALAPIPAVAATADTATAPLTSPKPEMDSAAAVQAKPEAAPGRPPAQASAQAAPPAAQKRTVVADAGSATALPPASIPAATLHNDAVAAQRTAPPEATSAPPAPGRKRVKAVQQFVCQGNEPFWALAIDRDTARYLALGTTGEPERLDLAGKLRVTGEGRTPDVDWRGKSPDGRAFQALIQERTCTDPMAEAQGKGPFAYRVTLTLPGGKAVKGCCQAGAAPSAEPSADEAPPRDASGLPVADLATRSASDWSRFLLDLLPAVDSCLEKTPGAGPYVTKAWMVAPGRVGVRTRNAVAGWFDCVAQANGRVVERFAPVTADSGSLPGEAMVLFTPARGSLLAGKCWQHERVLDRDGTLVGWLSANSCLGSRS